MLGQSALSAQSLADLHRAIAEAEDALLDAPPLPEIRAERMRQQANAAVVDALIAIGQLRTLLAATRPALPVAADAALETGGERAHAAQSRKGLL